MGPNLQASCADTKMNLGAALCTYLSSAMGNNDATLQAFIWAAM